MVVSEDTGTGLEIVTWVDSARLNVLGNLLIQRLSSHVDSVVLVGGLGESSHGRLAGDGLTVRNDWRRDLQWDTSVVLLEILQANLQMQLTGTGDNVLTRLRDESQDARIGLGKTLETFDELWKIVGVLDLDGDLDDRGDRELHDLQVVGTLTSGKSSRLEQELIDTDETENVSGWDILNWLNETSHHENGTLDSLDEEIILLSWNVVWSLDTDLETGADSSGEDTTESVETTLIGGRHHLGDVQHERSLRIAVTDTLAELIVGWTLVESLGTVSLGSDWGWQVENDHLQESISSWQELSHDDLEEGLSFEVLLVTLERDLELLEKKLGLFLLEVHDGSEDSEDWVEDEHVEGTLKSLSIGISSLGGPLLGLWVEVVVALDSMLEVIQLVIKREIAYPETVHHLSAINTELLSVALGELTDSESPSVETGTESDSSLVWVDLAVTEGLVEVGSDNNVNGFDGTGESLVQIFLGDLQFEEGTIDLVDDTNWSDTLRKSLTQDGLSLDTDTGDAVDDDKGTVGNTESSSDLRREINVTRRIDQVDQELVTLSLLGDILDVLLVHLGVKGDGGGLDGDTTILFVLTSIGVSGFSGLCCGDDTGALHQGIGQSGLAVIDCG